MFSWLAIAAVLDDELGRLGSPRPSLVVRPTSSGADRLPALAGAFEGRAVDARRVEGLNLYVRLARCRPTYALLSTETRESEKDQHQELTA